MSQEHKQAKLILKRFLGLASRIVILEPFVKEDEPDNRVSFGFRAKPDPQSSTGEKSQLQPPSITFTCWFESSPSTRVLINLGGLTRSLEDTFETQLATEMGLKPKSKEWRELYLNRKSPLSIIGPPTSEIDDAFFYNLYTKFQRLLTLGRSKISLTPWEFK